MLEQLIVVKGKKLLLLRLGLRALQLQSLLPLLLPKIFLHSSVILLQLWQPLNAGEDLNEVLGLLRIAFSKALYHAGGGKCLQAVFEVLHLRLSLGVAWQLFLGVQGLLQGY